MRGACLAITILVAIGWLAAPTLAHACVCYSLDFPSPTQNFRSAVAVFWGEVITYEAGSWVDRSADRVRFRVLEGYKGTVAGDIVDLQSGVSDCTWGVFQPGQDYLVFAYPDWGGQLRAALSVCEGESTIWRPDESDE